MTSWGTTAGKIAQGSVSPAESLREPDCLFSLDVNGPITIIFFGLIIPCA